MQTIHDFVKNHGIKMTCRSAATNPLMRDPSMSHHRCTLTCGARAGGRKRMTVTFSQGSAHHGKAPSVEDVLSTLAMDASGFENNPDFESWASEYGFGVEQMKTWKAVKKQTAALKKLVGSAYEELLYHTESL